MASGAELRLRELNLILLQLPAPEGNYVRQGRLATTYRFEDAGKAFSFRNCLPVAVAKWLDPLRGPYTLNYPRAQWAICSWAEVEQKSRLLVARILGMA
jgi:hypothetical protein